MNLKTIKQQTASLYLSADHNRLSRRLCDMGFADGMQVTALRQNPGHTLCAFQMHQSIIALRTEDLEKVSVTV